MNPPFMINKIMTLLPSSTIPCYKPFGRTSYKLWESVYLKVIVLSLAQCK